MNILFLHGWQSAPGGYKPIFLAQHGHEVINPQLPDGDFDEAVRIAQNEFDKHQPDVVVGESRGGTVAMNIEGGDARLVLLCPGWKKWGTVKTVKSSTVIFHSRSDDIVPFADSEDLVRNSDLPMYTLVEVGIDHWLNDPESLRMLLEACSDDPESVDGETEDEPILERDWTGQCYTAALRWISEADERDWVVVHGTVLSEKAGKRIDHAWCERGELVVDLGMPVGSRRINRELYHRVVKPEVSKSYSSDDALLLSVKSSHDGPWDDLEQLKQ